MPVAVQHTHQFGVIRKAAVFPVEPNLRDYEAACAAFTWDDAWRALDGLPGGRGLNIAHEAVDRHATGRPKGAIHVHEAVADRRAGHPRGLMHEPAAG